MVEKSYNRGTKGIGRFALPLTICLHIFVIYFLPTVTHNSTLLKSAPDALTVLLIPLQKNKNASVKIQALEMPQTSQLQAVKNQSTATSGAPTRSITVVPENTVAPVAEKRDSSSATETEAIHVDSMILNAKRDIGKIDRDLRKAFPSLSEPTPNTAQSKFEKALAAAAKPRSTMTETYTLADGRKMTKILGPGGTYCTFSESAGAADGIDHIQNGMKARVTNCPE
ncbi:MAG: hypothetical protein HHJ12_10990 [Glaciimonas sp.]|nr:hypothetical protein [Glaciimonas sp.]